MSISFSIIKPKYTLIQQWAYLAKRGNSNQLAVIKHGLLWLLGTTGLYMLFYFLSSPDNFITLKVVGMVMFALAWCTFVIICLVLSWKHKASWWKMRRYLNTIPASELTYGVEIDEDKVMIVTPDLSYELPWIDFTQYGIYKETLYVFNEANRNNTLYWDKSEMGIAPFTALVDLLQQKKIKRAF